MNWIELSVSLLKSTKLLDVSEITRDSVLGISIRRSPTSSDEIPLRCGCFSSLFITGDGDSVSSAYFNFSWTIRPGDIEWIFLGLTPTSCFTTLLASSVDSLEMGTFVSRDCSSLFRVSL